MKKEKTSSDTKIVCGKILDDIEDKIRECQRATKQQCSLNVAIGIIEERRKKYGV
jgi:hypothetical protein